MKRARSIVQAGPLVRTSMAVSLSAMLCVPLCTSAASVPASAVPVQAVTQGQSVKGTIVDETGTPMIGVTVKVKGGKAASVTDLDGNFSIAAKPGDELEVSYVGYKSATVKV